MLRLSLTNPDIFDILGVSGNPLRGRLGESEAPGEVDACVVLDACVVRAGEKSVEQSMGTAVGNSHVWFRFNEGVSNAVRRNVYIRELL